MATLSEINRSRLKGVGHLKEEKTTEKHSVVPQMMARFRNFYNL